MAHATLVQILDSADEFPVELGRLGFIETRISDDEVEELAAIRVLHDHEEFFLRLDDLRSPTRGQASRGDEANLPRRAG